MIPKKKSKQKSKQKDVYKLDASGQSLGRLASKAAFLLTDKNKPDYAPNRAGTNVVQIENVNKINFTGKKLKNKKYYHHTGYPGALREKNLEEAFAENPQKIVRQTIYGMLPKNKLRDQRIERLQFN